MGDFAQTAAAVATKGGATEQGIICFEENKLQPIVEDAVQRAYKKNDMIRIRKMVDILKVKRLSAFWY